MSQIPAYFDFLIAAYHAGATGRCVHLGWWPLDRLTAPLAIDEREFLAAQHRLDRQILALVPLRDHQTIVDVACGFGGTLQEIDARQRDLSLHGVNIDPRQLDICRQLTSSRGNRWSWHPNDACQLPFASATCDGILCVEAMFHFASRRDFLAEVARVLRRGGWFIATDFVATARPTTGCAAQWTTWLQEGFGPWPDPWCDARRWHAYAADAGLSLTYSADWSVATLPSHQFTAPPPAVMPEDVDDPTTRAACILRNWHAEGIFHYRLMRCERA